MKKPLIVFLFAYAPLLHAMEGFPQEKLWKKANAAYRKALEPKKPLSKKLSVWFKTIEQRDIEKAFALVKTHDIVNARNLHNATALHHLVLNNPCDEQALELAQLLLEHGANPNVQDNAGNTPLHYLFKADYDSLQKIFDLDKQISTLSKHICAPQTCKCAQIVELKAQRWQVKTEEDKKRIAYRKMIKALLYNYASLSIANPRLKPGAQTVMELYPDYHLDENLIGMCIEAFESEDFKMVEHVLNEGVDPNSKCKQGKPLLFHAADSPNPLFASYLMINGADLRTTHILDNHNAINIIEHLACRKQFEMLPTLLTSPQGNAHLHKGIPNLNKIKREISTFLACVSREDECINILNIGEIKHHICRFLLPSVTTLVDDLPFRPLRTYASLWLLNTRLINQNQLLDALTKKHMNTLLNVLRESAHAEPPFNVPAHMLARMAEDENKDIIINEPCYHSRLLDPDDHILEHQRETIKAHYKSLLY